MKISCNLSLLGKILSLKEVRSSLHSRELRHKAAGTGGADTEAVGLIARGVKDLAIQGRRNRSRRVPRVLNLAIFVTTIRRQDIGKISVLKRRGSKPVLLLSQKVTVSLKKI